MNNFIKIQDKDLFLIGTELLGVSEAQLWLSRPDGPTNNDDDRVNKQRTEDRAAGLVYGIEAIDLTKSQNYPG